MEGRLLDDPIECFRINEVEEIQGDMMEQDLSQEIKDYIVRLHVAGYPFSAIAFKVDKEYHFSVTREMVDLVIREHLSKTASAKLLDSSLSS
jgi:hypothetical protein